jgi:hypothetical protein
MAIKAMIASADRPNGGWIKPSSLGGGVVGGSDVGGGDETGVKTG